jgi:hypothetical protein
MSREKYSEDPLLFRNYFLKIPLNFYYMYINFKNILVKYKLHYSNLYFYHIFIIIIFQIVHKFSSLSYNKVFYLYNFLMKKVILDFLIKKNYIHINKNLLLKLISLMLYFLSFLILNFIYLLLNFFFFFIYIILYSFIKLKKKFIYLLILVLLFKYF